MTFGERLIELRKEKGFTQKYVANSISVAQPTYALYETGERKPSVSILIRMAYYFGVTTDYLLGLDDIRTHDETIMHALLEDRDNRIRKYRMCLCNISNEIGDVLNANQTQS